MVLDDTHRARVLAALGGVLVIDLVFVVFLALLVDPLVATAVEALVRAAGVGAPSAPVRWAAVTLLTLVAFVAVQLAYVRRRTLAEAEAREVDREEYPDLVDRVQRLSQVAGVRPPAVAVAPSSVPNSFTVGGVANATLVVSEGLLSTLPEEELDAVLAHELAHVVNRDVRVMTLASLLPALAKGDLSPPRTPGTVLAGVVGVIVLYGLSVPHLGGSPLVFLLALGIVVVVGAVALGVLAAPVLVLARRLSRYREYAADRAGATICGSPAALASALYRLDDDRRPATDKRRAYGGGVERLCLLPGGFEGSDEEGEDGLEIRSHPSTEERIERLRDVAAEH